MTGTASHTSCRSHDMGVCPGGTGSFGSAGFARRSGNASSSASTTERATAPGYRANRVAISAPDRRNAPPCAGSQPSSSSMLRFARTAATAAARVRVRGSA
ncbi:hypothetical protein RR49_00740 [Microbacterium ginsengisoli]|uniref:Uncharacterized protein n=1 Tax=Microbacterium ginsengisoli TaxID=400772 RepID=A0A0F0LW43_9MICO|nr:hypothetical protein RR49_00740 [Microbacterium ginsengisoli]